MKRRTVRRGRSVVALCLQLTGVACNQSSHSAQVGSSSAAIKAQAGDAAAVTAVSGYGACTQPACADVARACDDIMRTGCGTPYLYKFDGGLVSPTTCTSDFDFGVAACTVAVWAELTDILDAFKENEEEDAGPPLQPVRSVLAAELANCTRRARNCDERLNCTRGTFIPPPPIFDAGVLAPPPDAAGPAPIPPFVGGVGSTSVSTGAPWQDAGVPAIDLIPGVDSPSCASCAIERCPTFAYRCFSAESGGADCPAGDCCHSLRQCILECGGYSAQATMPQFVACLSQCSVGRPHSAQELADLQRCGTDTCAGCETYDQKPTRNEGQP
jgi:hypothetical protein